MPKLAYEDLAAISSMKARLETADWKNIMLSIAAAPTSMRVRRMKELAASGVAGYGTIRRKFYEYESLGTLALVDRRRVKSLTSANPWLEIYMRYIENDTNSSMGGWRRMMEDFRAGVPMGSGQGTWRDVWKRERPFEAMPAECPLDFFPAGATYSNLQTAATKNPDYRFQIAASRRGRKAASPYLLPVLTTRVGLPILAKVEYDDVWHNTDVLFMGKAVQCLEFAGYDVASAYKCSSIIKPRFTREDGRRDNLKEQQFRFLFAYDHIVRGFHRGGIEDIIEHGTTAIREKVERQIKAIPGVGEKITIRRSGILSEQVHAGLFIGNGGGNFKMKALCEGAHNILHNRTASLIGSRGRDAEHMHESQAALVKYEERLAAAAARLKPATALKLQAGLLSFEEYLDAFRTIEAQLMDDPEHRLEGWDGHVKSEWRLATNSNDWHDSSELVEMAKSDPDGARAIAAVIGRDKRLRRSRPMSRREVYQEGVKSGEIIHVDDWYMPHFLDIERDAIEIKVRDNGLFGFRNEAFYGRDEMIYRAQVMTHEGWTQSLAPGDKAVCCFNPMIPDKVWLLDAADGHTLGTCNIYNRAPAYDRHAIEIAMGDQAADLARKVLPVRGRHQAEAEERAARIANNARVLGMVKVKVEGEGEDGEAFSLDELAEDKLSQRRRGAERNDESGSEAFSLEELSV